MRLMGEGTRPTNNSTGQKTRSIPLIMPPQQPKQTPPPRSAHAPEAAFISQMPQQTVSDVPPVLDKSLMAQFGRLFEVLFRKSWFGWLWVAVSFFIGKWVFGVPPLLNSVFAKYVLCGFAFAVWGLGWGAWVKYGYPIDRKNYIYYGHNNWLAIVLMALGGAILYAPEFFSSGEIVVLPLGVIIVGLLIQISLFFVPSFDEAGPAFMREMYVAGLILLAGLMRVIGPGWW